jgi:hypothetical protein
MPAPRPCPVPEASQKWLENAFSLLIDLFGEDPIRSRKVLVPHHTDFPIRYNGDISTAADTLQIVASQMEVAPNDILLDFYEDSKSVSTGSLFGGEIHLNNYKNISASSGLYWGRHEDGKYHIWLEKKNLTDPEGLVATLAHEIAHIKLLGEGRIEKNDEHLTDLTVMVFGLGIFTANVAFRHYSTFRGWGYSSKGYVKQREWGYGLALFARLREEKDPAWAKHLTKNIRSDFAKSQAYLEDQG